MSCDVMRIEDLVDNPNPRVPVCLCLNTSDSMISWMDELNSGLRSFYKIINKDGVAKYFTEIAIVTFGGEAKNITDFATLNLQPNAPTLIADGETPMGEAVNLALDMLEARKKDYQSKGVDYYQPWLVLMSDGAPNGDNYELERAIGRTCGAINDKKLTIFPIGIGDRADMAVLKRFSPKREPLRLKGLCFREFFAWLSKSVSKTSQSTPGDKIELDVGGIKGWSTI